MEDVSLTALILENIVGQKDVLNEVVQKILLNKLKATSEDIHLFSAFKKENVCIINHNRNWEVHVT